jgi:hypothetical protein
MKAQRSRGIAVPCRGGWSTPRPGRFTPGNNPVPIVQEAGWATGPVWTGAEVKAHGAATSRPAARRFEDDSEEKTACLLLASNADLHDRKSLLCGRRQQSTRWHDQKLSWPTAALHVRQYAGGCAQVARCAAGSDSSLGPRGGATQLTSRVTCLANWYG